MPARFAGAAIFSLDWFAARRNIAGRGNTAMRHMLATCLLLAAPLPALAETAILPVKMLDTSGEAQDQQADHDRRTALLAQVLGEELPAALITPQDLAACQPQTTDCLLSTTAAAGADRALFIVAQKTSTLILQLFVNLVDTRTGELLDSRNLNFRGDNDEAWRRAGVFLAGQIRDAAP